MNTLDLAALQKFTAQAQKLQAIVKDIMPMIEVLKTAQITLPTD